MAGEVVWYPVNEGFWRGHILRVSAWFISTAGRKIPAKILQAIPAMHTNAARGMYPGHSNAPAQAGALTIAPLSDYGTNYLVPRGHG